MKRTHATSSSDTHLGGAHVDVVAAAIEVEVAVDDGPNTAEDELEL